MIDVQPEARVGDEERRHLGTPEIVDVRAPVLMESLARIGVFVEMRAVEIREPVRITREMRRHPVEQHADARGMRRVDEGDEIFRRAEAARRREHGDGLIAPRPVERKLGDRQKLDMGEAHVAHIRHEAVGELAIGEITVVLFRHARPRAEVTFVDRDRTTAGITLPARLDPVRVVPGRLRQAREARGGRRWMLRREGEGIGLQRQQMIVGADDLELVALAEA